MSDIWTNETSLTTMIDDAFYGRTAPDMIFGERYRYFTDMATGNSKRMGYLEIAARNLLRNHANRVRLASIARASELKPLAQVIRLAKRAVTCPYAPEFPHLQTIASALNQDWYWDAYRQIQDDDCDVILECLDLLLEWKFPYNKLTSEQLWGKIEEAVLAATSTSPSFSAWQSGYARVFAEARFQVGLGDFLQFLSEVPRNRALALKHIVSNNFAACIASFPDRADGVRRVIQQSLPHFHQGTENFWALETAYAERFPDGPSLRHTHPDSPSTSSSRPRRGCYID